MGNVDLSPLTGLVYCFDRCGLRLLRAVAGLWRISRGLVIGRSTQREQMVRAIRPIQSILIMVFFFGRPADRPEIHAENFWTVLVVLLVVTLFKTAMNIGIMRLLGETWQRASLQGLTLSQLGEFSFLLAAQDWRPAPSARRIPPGHRRHRPQPNAKPALAYQRARSTALPAAASILCRSWSTPLTATRLRLSSLDRVGLSSSLGFWRAPHGHAATQLLALARIKTRHRRTLGSTKIPARPNDDASLRESGNGLTGGRMAKIVRRRKTHHCRPRNLPRIRRIRSQR